MDKDLSILTDNQRKAWLLRTQGMSYKRIADDMGISAYMARMQVQNAQRRFYQYQNFCREKVQNEEIITIELSKGELRVIVDGLRSVQDALVKKAHMNVKTDWRGRLPYQCQIISTALKKTQIAAFGKIIYLDITEE